MNAMPPFFDLSAAGCMAASVCAGAEERAEQAPPPFAADPRAPRPAQRLVPARPSGWRRLAGGLFDLVSGPERPR